MRPAALSNPSWEATLDELSPHPASPRNYHAAFFKENRRRGRRQQHEVGNPGTPAGMTILLRGQLRMLNPVGMPRTIRQDSRSVDT